MELRNLLLSEVWIVQTAQILWGNIVGIQRLQGCIHFKIHILGRVFRNDAEVASSVATLTAGSKE
ncbi:hypothetical protein D3C86_2110950 [compost metagenome]